MLDTYEERKALADRTKARSKGKIDGWQKNWIDFKFLFAEQVLQMRKLWQVVLVYSLILPCCLIFGFSRLGSGLSDRNSLVYIIAGSAVCAMVMEGITGMAQMVGYMKSDGRLLYYASLPINKASFVAALLLSRLLVVSLPGLITPLILGAFFYGFNLLISMLWAIILLPVCGLALSGCGMSLGLSLDSLEAVIVTSNIVVFVIILLSPVFIPVTSLPLPLQWLSYVLPTTYAADALRQVLLSNISPGFYLDLAILGLMISLSLWWVHKGFKFRLG